MYFDLSSMNLKGGILVFISLVIGAFVPQLSSSLLPTNEARVCLAVLVVTAIWWIFEPFPSYVTSLAVVPLCVALKIVDAKAAAAAFFDPVMFLFISGFSIAGTLDKYGLTGKLSSPLIKQILSYSTSVGGDLVFHMGISLLCVCLSALVSNVAASVLVSGIGDQLVSSMHMEARAHKRLVLTIAYACNVGGMIVPIASPQNIIALSVVRSSGNNSVVSFGQWLMYASPLCLGLLLVIYIVLRRRFGVSGLMNYKRVDDYDLELTEPISPQRRSRGNSLHTSKEPTRGSFSFASQIAVAIFVCITITGWCLFEQLKLDRVFSHMGIFGIATVTVMHAVGLVGQSDWQSLPWPTLSLLGGGIALGEAVDHSGLLTFIAESITQWAANGYSAWTVYCVFLLGIGIVANFMSSTVCAVIIFPIVAKVGNSLGHGPLFTVAAALMTSGAMALPVSSFPNANGAAAKDNQGNILLSIGDFTKTGFPVAIVMLGLLVTVGFPFGINIFG
jgi:phosphate transporter